MNLSYNFFECGDTLRGSTCPRECASGPSLFDHHLLLSERYICGCHRLSDGRQMWRRFILLLAFWTMQLLPDDALTCHGVCRLGTPRW